MHKIIRTALSLIVIAFLLTGCMKPQETTKVEMPATSSPAAEKKPVGPDITLIVASVNLSSISRRIEKDDIVKLSNALKNEKVEILAIQGIARYPGIATRIDVVDEIATAMEMRKVFGETISLSGRQSGNAVFSTYPISSNENRQYVGISSTNFESALLTVIDGGTRDIAVVSTLLPEKASADDLSKCVSTLTTMRQSYGGTPMIVMGNLPAPPKSNLTNELEPFKLEQVSLNRGDLTYRTWYANEGLQSITTKTIETNLGNAILTKFGLYRKPQP